MVQLHPPPCPLFHPAQHAAYKDRVPLELSHLMQLFLGQRPSLTVGDLPREIAEYLSCHPAVVYLRRAELLKIATKHTLITDRHVQCLPYMIAEGRYLTDKRRRNCVTVFYKHPEDQELYRAGLKATDKGGEVWVATLHRSDKHEEARHTRKEKILRDYKRK